MHRKGFKCGKIHSPAPQTRTLLPMVIPALLQACTATERGSRRAPSSNDT